MFKKAGYIIKKTKDNFDDLIKLKIDLTVRPHAPPQFKKDNKPFPVYQETEKELIIPRYYAMENLGENIKKGKIRYTKNSASFKFNGSLRDYQNDIIKTVIPKLKEIKGGLISLKCGGGKTVLSLYIASKLKKKTLVIVHKTFLLNQWKERISQFTNAKIGEIRQDKVIVEDCDIVIGMLQSISKDKYTEDLFKQFGLVIFDEAHHAPSRYFSRALPIINSEYMLALSATPKRSDKLEKVLHWYFGPIIYQDKDTTKRNVLVKMFNYHLEDKQFKEAMLPFGADVNLPKTINRITKLKKRNEFIIKQIKEIVLEEGRKILLLSDRVNHLEEIKMLLDKEDLTDNDFYIGRMKQKDLDIARERQIILGTFAMAAEALDIPELNTLIMTTSRRNVEQSVGRILRTQDSEIQPLILDFNDKLNCFQRQGKARTKFYLKKGYDIISYTFYNNNIIKEENITSCKETVIESKIENDDLEFID